MSQDAQWRLTPAQVASFFEDGFLGPLPAYVSPEALAPLAEFLTRVELERVTQPLYGRFSSRDWHLVEPRLQALFTHPGMVTPLRQLMGEDLLLWRSSTFIKPPFGAELGWHQEWGTFAGLEYGNDIPSLQPSVPSDSPWNITIWFALTDVDARMGPIRFVRGSHRRQYPVEQVSMPESAFFDPGFGGIEDPREFVRRARDHTLVIDIDTSRCFDDVDEATLTLEEARRRVLEHLSTLTGEVARPFEIAPGDLVELPMRAGEFVIFFERVMHGSGENRSPRPRPGVNCRVTPSSTLVYPQRLTGAFMDGSNLDIRAHRCLRLSGGPGHPDNVYL
ncbi:MAG: phytanoyl-CoA dioxygenase family protein [Alphaproteobacteria bacterium]|nr:phytanoyl-CoA dioxygenase family protein [Alphaproteobacteria bacterium]